MDYQNRLNILLSQPEILKKMNEIILKRKTEPMTNEEDDLSQAKKKSEMKKKQIKLKINYHINQINLNKQDSLINKILDEIKKEKNSESVEVTDILNKEIYKQENNFKNKLAQKKSIVSVHKKHSQLLQKTPNELNLVECRVRRSYTSNNRPKDSKKSKFHLNEVNEPGIEIERETKSEISEKNSLDEDENNNYSYASSSEKEEDNLDISKNNFQNYEEKKINELDEIFKKIEIQEKNIISPLKGKKKNSLNDNEKILNSINNSRHSTAKDLNTSLLKIDESVGKFL